MILKMRLILYTSILIIVIVSKINSQTLPPMLPNKTIDGMRQGEWTIWYTSAWKKTDNVDSAKLYRKVTYKNNKPYGLVTDYYLGGAKQWQGNLITDEPEDIKADGICYFYYENGQISSEVTIKNSKDIKTVAYFKNGFLNFISHDSGQYIGYFENRNIKAEGKLLDGKKIGKWLWYYSNSKKESEVNYDDKGNLNGKYISYYENGGLKNQGWHKDGNKCSIWHDYDTLGNIYSQFNHDSFYEIDNYWGFVFNQAGNITKLQFSERLKLFDSLGEQYRTTIQYNSLYNKLQSQLKSGQFDTSILFDPSMVKRGAGLFFLSLIVNAKSMDNKDKQAWLNLFPLMNDWQTNRLSNILMDEKIRFKLLNLTYDLKKLLIKQKYVNRWQKMAYLNGTSSDSSQLHLSLDNTSFNEFNKLLSVHVQNMKTYSSERKLTELSYSLNNLFKHYFTLALDDTNSYNTSNLLNCHLVLKNMSLSNKIIFNTIFSKTPNLKIKELYKEYKEINLLTENADSIKESKEVRLMESSNEFLDYIVNEKVGWEDIKNNLKSDEVALEYVSLTKDSVLTVFIIHNSWAKPKLLRICSLKDLEIGIQNEMNNWNNITEYPNNRGFELEQQSKNFTNSSESICNLILKPISQFLKGINTIYYVPSGILTNMNFSSIKFSNNKKLLDSFKIKQLMDFNSFKHPRQYDNIDFLSAELYGGINFDSNSDFMNSETKYQSIEKNYSRVMSQIFPTNGKSPFENFKYLPGTLKEVDLIYRKISDNDRKIILVKGKDANKFELKKYSGDIIAPQILHIATHGFYIPSKNEISAKGIHDVLKNNKNNKWNVIDNPLLRSGLIFSGVNRFLKNLYNGSSLNPDSFTSDNGIMTALEISQLNLTGCKLVVLSACKSGLGDVSDINGVFGLQRAFKVAGVENLLLSLWDIDDEKSQEFMVDFYTELIKVKNIHNAFYTTQKAFKVKYPNPYYWAAFVLIE